MDDDRRCTATSKQTGQRCRRAAIIGGHVCSAHGGKAPQVRQAASERLAAAADPAAGRLVNLVRSRDETVALRASCAVLDRTGHGKRSAVDVSTSVRVEAERLVAFTRGLLEDLGIPLTPDVREIAAARLRTMAAAQAEHAPHLRAVPR